jgi:hypothetical protein
MIIFTEAIAAELIRKGFNPIEKGKRHWEFIDSVRLEAAVSELTAALVDNDL